MSDLLKATLRGGFFHAERRRMKVTIWHAKWCAPCKGTLQTFVPLLKEENIPYELMDIDEHPCAARKANICYLPTVIGIIPACAGNIQS